MSEAVTQMADHFPLAHFERALQNFRPPVDAFDSQGAWVNAYDIWECSQGFAKLGAVRIERTPVTGGGAQLDVKFRKVAKGGTMRMEMRVECHGDALATPERWQAQSVVHDGQDAPIEDLRMRERGEVRRGELWLTAGRTRTRTALEGPATVQWCLFDAVQRLPGPALEPLSFTLLDRVSCEVKPDQRLAFRCAATVEVGGKRVWREERQDLERGTVYRPVAAREGAVPLRLHAYDHTGRGIVPIVYWVDEHGRLLFVLSGLFGYIFNAEAQP